MQSARGAGCTIRAFTSRSLPLRGTAKQGDEQRHSLPREARNLELGTWNLKLGTIFSPFQFAQRPFVRASIGGGHAVEDENAFEVVVLVLPAAGIEALADEGERLAVAHRGRQW